MKNILLLCLFSALALPAAARADTVYTVTGGILSSPYLGTTPVGTYSGTFTLNSFFTLQSGNFTATVNGVTYAPLNIIVGNNPTSGYAAFFDVGGDHLNFALLGTTSQADPTLCTVALCGSGDTLFDPASGGNFSANGGTLSGGTIPVIAATPEPSSLILLGTGALSLAGALRRRCRS